MNGSCPTSDATTPPHPCGTATEREAEYACFRRLVYKIGGEFARGDAHHCGRSTFRQRREERPDTRLDLAKPRQHFVVLSNAEACGTRIWFGPACVACGPRDPAQD